MPLLSPMLPFAPPLFFFRITRLKGILPQVFCVYLLHDERYSGFLVAVYGLGGILGSMTFKR